MTAASSDIADTRLPTPLPKVAVTKWENITGMTPMKATITMSMTYAILLFPREPGVNCKEGLLVPERFELALTVVFGND